jgi:hypothetical protein
VCVCVCVCVCTRVLLRRWLGKRCHMSYHYSAIPQFWERFDCPTYFKTFQKVIRMLVNYFIKVVHFMHFLSLFSIYFTN